MGEPTATPPAQARRLGHLTWQGAAVSSELFLLGKPLGGSVASKGFRGIMAQ